MIDWPQEPFVRRSALAYSLRQQQRRLYYKRMEAKEFFWHFYITTMPSDTFTIIQWRHAPTTMALKNNTTATSLFEGMMEEGPRSRESARGISMFILYAYYTTSIEGPYDGNRNIYRYRPHGHGESPERRITTERAKRLQVLYYCLALRCQDATMRQWNGLSTMGEPSIIYMTINKSKCEMPTIKELCTRLTTPCMTEKKI